MNSTQIHFVWFELVQVIPNKFLVSLIYIVDMNGHQKILIFYSILSKYRSLGPTQLRLASM